MTRGEVAIVVGVLLCSVGAGLFHPGAGLVVAGLGFAALGAALIWFSPEHQAENEEST